jgi:uncharacterized protein YjbJ (UPF0337 family)
MPNFAFTGFLEVRSVRFSEGPRCNLPRLLAYLILRTREERRRREMEKAKGKAKEAFVALTGDEALKAEGRAEQRKADAEAEAKQREKTRRVEA